MGTELHKTAAYRILDGKDGRRYRFFCEASGMLLVTTEPVCRETPEEELEAAWKEQGIKHFDFWGIAPEGAPDDHPWKGFTKFKQSFGGRPVAYAGTYDIIINPFKYHLYQLVRKINQKIRKLDKTLHML